MSNDRTTDTRGTKPSVVSTIHRKARILGQEHSRQDVEVVSFEIADDDFGGDPYNHTGSHCVLKDDENS